MKLTFLGLTLIVFILISLLAIGRGEVVTSKVENSTVKFYLKDFPEHGISLVAPTDPAFAKTVPPNPYSVILKNASSRMVVGYAIKWECTGKMGAVNRPHLYDRIVSNVAGVVFMYGDEPGRREVMNKMAQVIKPKSTWLISFDFNPRQIGVAGAQPDPEIDNEFFDPVRAACPNMTVIADGIFFDDGTFIGPDTSNFFAETKAQLDARYAKTAKSNKMNEALNTEVLIIGYQRFAVCNIVRSSFVFTVERGASNGHRI